MRILLSALLLALLAPAAGASVDTVNVRLELRENHLLLPTTTSCDLAVPAGADAGAVLDAAVLSGCISSWAYTADPQFGRYVTAINGKADGPAFYWAYYENGLPATHGIDYAAAAEGQVFGFAYADYATGLAASFLPVALP